MFCCHFDVLDPTALYALDLYSISVLFRRSYIQTKDNKQPIHSPGTFEWSQVVR